MSASGWKSHIVLKLLATVLRSPYRNRMIVMLLILGAIMAAETWMTVKMATYSGHIVDALTRRDGAIFYVALSGLVLSALAFTACSVTFAYLNQRLTMEARTALTYPWLGHWLDDKAIYRLEREHRLDNPDQRIAEDLKLFLDKSMSLGIGGYSALLGVGAFSVMLWRQGGPLEFTLAGQHWSIPGYLFWVALIFAIVNTWLTRWIAKPLVNLNMQQQRVEADFRFGMIQVREHAEQVALYRGADTEYVRLTNCFEHVRQNWWRLIAYQMRWASFAFTTTSFSTYATYILLAPRVLAGAMTIGGMTTLHTVFGNVIGKLNWFAGAWGDIVVWIAIVNRLKELDHAIDLPAVEGIEVSESDTSMLVARDLMLELPEGAALATIGDLQVQRGQRWLVRGPSGVGKSTLLRAIAGLWPYGHGAIDKPGQGLLFLPQKSYLPWDTLKVVLAYPQAAEFFSDEACRQALLDCRLPKLANHLHERERWSLRLSLGEQQRVAFARALLIKPDFLFLDESTSALDMDTERHLYQLLLERLPDTALISVAHRTTLDPFHSHCLQLNALGPALQSTIPIVAPA